MSSYQNAQKTHRFGKISHLFFTKTQEKLTILVKTR